jgi:hypothetical protein
MRQDRESVTTFLLAIGLSASRGLGTDTGTSEPGGPCGSLHVRKGRMLRPLPHGRYVIISGMLRTPSPKA